MHLESDHEATLYARNVYSREGNSIKIMSCTMNPKLQCMRETIVLEKEIHQTSCGVTYVKYEKPLLGSGNIFRLNLSQLLYLRVVQGGGNNQD